MSIPCFTRSLLSPIPRFGLCLFAYPCGGVIE